jgi:16S rRNA (cytosine1402-N4)-methyltransferase
MDNDTIKNREHLPVLLNESIEALNIKPDGIYVDGTLGRGGHSYEIARRLISGRLIGIDRDEAAISASSERLSAFGGKINIIKGNFSDVGEILDSLNIDKADGMLFDLGLSSPQVDEAERGFSYMTDAPLDMRMDRSSALTAYEIVNKWDESELRRILFEYGEERFSSKIAAAITAARRRKEIDTTLELVDIIKTALPASALREKQHPAKRSFQALRIAVNDELGSIEKMLETVPDRLNTGGRLCVISFHSLEDRLVKQAIRKREKGCTCPRDFPVCICGFKQTMKAIGGPVTASDSELETNHRARSAKLRVAERV